MPAPCPRCGAINRSGAKFCDECGKSLSGGNAPTHITKSTTVALSEEPLRVPLGAEAESIPEGERKTVTALFADIKGSMELMEDLDPEEARAIIDPALKLMMDAVHRYGGFVVQSTGDGIFALFGAPIAHEDHPQRALYSALRMQTDIKRYAAGLREQGRAPLQIRVGVNTGEVVVRSL